MRKFGEIVSDPTERERERERNVVFFRVSGPLLFSLCLPSQHHQPNHQQPPPSSPTVRLQPTSPTTPTFSNHHHRKIAIAVDLSDESAHAVKWAVQNYLRPGDAVILLHVRPTTFLYGADWGSIQPQLTPVDEADQMLTEEQFDSFTTNKTNSLAQPLVDAQIPFKIHIVKDHDMKERLCLEVERLGLSAVIMGSRGFGAARMRSGRGRLGSVSDYCVQHCVCPVVVVRYPDEQTNGGSSGEGGGEVRKSCAKKTVVSQEVELHPVPEEEDVNDEHEHEQ